MCYRGDSRWPQTLVCAINRDYFDYLFGKRPERFFNIKGSRHMAITRTAKEQAVDTLGAELGRIKLAVMTDYRGLTVREVEELRGILRAEGITYRVTKNT